MKNASRNNISSSSSGQRKAQLGLEFEVELECALESEAQNSCWSSGYQVRLDDFKLST